MKKFLLFAVVSCSFFACSVDEVPENNKVNAVDASYTGDDCTLDAGEDNSLMIEYSDAAAIESWDEVRKLFLTLLEPGVPRNGTFEPSIWDIIGQFHQQGLGDLTTTYTIKDGECSDSVNLTVTVVPDGYNTTPCEINAGADNMLTITESEAAAIESWDEVRKLYLSLLEQGVSRNGTFDPTIWDIINRFNRERIGDFTTTYTIGEGDCTDSVDLTIRVIEDTPACQPVNAGADGSGTLTVEAARAMGATYGGVERIFFRLLEKGVTVEGHKYSFNPTIDEIIAQFSASPVGVYKTTLTIGEGECSDSVNLTLTVIP